MLQEGHSTVPHPGGEEEDPAVDPKVARGVPRRGGVEGDPGVDPKVTEKPIERKVKRLFNTVLNFAAQIASCCNYSCLRESEKIVRTWVDPCRHTPARLLLVV